MLSQIEACSLPMLFKLSVTPLAGNQTYPKKDRNNLRIDCGFLLVVISDEVLSVFIFSRVPNENEKHRFSPNTFFTTAGYLACTDI